MIGGNLSAKGYDAEKQAAWNMLIANPAEMLGAGQDGGQDDLLQAGNAGATMKGGGLGNDNLYGSDDPLAGSDNNSVNPSLSSQYVMIAGKDDKGLGGDYMLAGYGQTDFEWQEGAGPLTVRGILVTGSNSQLDVLGAQDGETWTITSLHSDIPGYEVAGQDKNQQSIGQIDALEVPVVSVDAADSANTGGESYVIDDLSDADVSQVNVNLHEYTTSPDANGDHVTIKGGSGDDTVYVGVQQVATGQYGSNGEPIYKQQWTTASVNTSIDGQEFSYHVDAALPKSSDTLAVNTFAGDDSVTVTDTQPDATTVSTAGGNDAIEVGGPGSALDDIQGPLFIDAGAGSNAIMFDDAASSTGDILTLTSSLSPGHSQPGLPTPQGYLLRYVGQIVTLYGQPSSYRYPMDVTFQSTGGDFSGGVKLEGTYSFDPSQPDQIYVQSVLANAPTTVQTNGEDAQVYVGFDGGASGTTSDPSSTLDDLDSTLDVIDANGPTTTLTIDDEGSPRADTYRVTQTDVERVNTQATIDYSSLGQLVLKVATPEANTIHVFGTASGTTTTIDAGAGNNTVAVSDLSPSLDHILGPLTINGGTGQDPLTIDDSGDGKAQQYELTATQLERIGSPNIVIDFNAISSLSFHASENSDTNVIAVEGTPAGVPVEVLPGGGTDNLGAFPLDDIQGPLTFQWSKGTKTFAVLDTTAKASDTYVVSPDEITRTGAATIQFDDSDDPLSTLFLAAGGLAPAEIDVPQTDAATSVLIEAGDAADTVLVSNAQQNLDTIQGQLSIQGTSTTSVILSDQDGPGGRDYILDAGSVHFNTSAPAVKYTGPGSVTLEGSPGPDRYTVKGTGQTAVDVVAQGTGNVMAAVNSTTINSILAASWSITGVDTGSLMGRVDFQGIQDLQGGAGTDDAFAFEPGAMITGSINGTGGGNWLDYLAYDAPVAVDLAAGTATAVQGGVRGVEDVRGGPDGSNLVGDAHGNVLIGGPGNDMIQGGSGRSILIGGKGTDQITAGAGDAILIGGTTDDDPSSLAKDEALEAILAAWQSGKSYDTRIKDIMKGVGPSKSFRLVWKTTVHDDGSASKLIGGHGRDWFFKGAKDKLVHKKPGERVN